MTQLSAGPGFSNLPDQDPCAREPIHVPGGIQPHGVLLTLNPDFTILQYAGDISGMLGLDPETCVGVSLKAHLGSGTLDQLDVLLARTEIAKRPFPMLQITVGSSLLDVCAHLSDGLVVLEIERHLDVMATNSIDLSRQMIAGITHAESIQQLIDSMASEVQLRTGFDRVMIYRFDAEGNGEVVAEKCRHDAIEPFLGLHYPASDIPPQARVLYTSNWIRCIPDVSYIPSKIIPPANPLTGLPLNLTFSALRSVSPVHLEYLANMGVAASMSLSIVVGGQLWGLIACHHYETRHLNSDFRTALELFAQLSSLQLTTLLEIDRKRRETDRRDFQDDFLAAMTSQGYLAGLRDNGPLLMSFMSAAGVAVHVGHRTSCCGQVPGESSIAAIIDQLNSRPPNRVWSTDRLAQSFPEAGLELCGMAGMLALSVSLRPRDYVLWFLPEQVTTVVWAGDPRKSSEVHLRLSPRKSFAAWREQVSGRSRGWEQDEIDAALRIRALVLEFALVHSDEVTREQDQLTSQQQLVMSELDHRVKNIFATIQAMVRFSSKSADSLVQFTQMLQQRLGSMARAHDLLTSSRWEGASLHRLVIEELAPYCSADDSKLRISGYDVMLSPSNAISVSMLVHELATNAVKHGSLSVENGWVEVKSNRVENGRVPIVAVEWVEGGGPLVAVPTRRGFGRLLLEKVFQRDSYGGSVDLIFEPTGVRCLIRVPLHGLAVAPVPIPSGRTGASPDEAIGAAKAL